MKTAFASVITVGVVFAGGMAMQRASAQDSTQFPGQPTRPIVWIQNRGDLEAVPVSIENVSTDSALRVALDPAGVVQVRTTRQAWQYLRVSVAAGQDPVPALNAAGADGWETTGITIAAAGATVIVLKRPA